MCVCKRSVFSIDDDDDDDDDEDGVSPFDEDDPEFVDETIYRFPMGDNDADDIDLMIHYPDSDNHFSGLDVDLSRAIQLPLWSDVNGTSGGGGLDGLGGGAVGAGGHVAPTHPLLSRQAGVEIGENLASTGILVEENDFALIELL